MCICIYTYIYRVNPQPGGIRHSYSCCCATGIREHLFITYAPSRFATTLQVQLTEYVIRILGAALQESVTEVFTTHLGPRGVCCVVAVLFWSCRVLLFLLCLCVCDLFLCLPPKPPVGWLPPSSLTWRNTAFLLWLRHMNP